MNEIVFHNGKASPTSVNFDFFLISEEEGKLNLKISNQNSLLHLIEIYDEPTSVNALKIELDPFATLKHTRIHLKNHSIINTTIIQEKQSSYQATIFYFPGAIHNSNFNIHLQGENAACVLYAGFTPKGREKSSLKVHVHHHGEKSFSQVVIRGVIDEEANMTCEGKIIINKTAKFSNACLENKNILLSNLATVRTDPILEVYTEEVEQCKHGATVGSLDNEALFYLQSRGLSLKNAKALLIEAFLEPILNRIELPVFKEYLLGNS